MLSRAHNYSLTSRSKYRNTLNRSTERAITTKQTNIKPNNTFQKTNAWKPSLTHANSRSNTSVFFPTKGFQWTGDMLHFKRQFSTEKLSNTQEPSHEADQKPPTENINALKNKTETFHRTLSIYAEEKNPEKALETFNVFTKEGGVQPTEQSYLMMIGLFAKVSDVPHLEQFFNEMRAAGFKPTAALWETLLRKFSEQGKANKVLQYLEVMKTEVPLTATAFSYVLTALQKAVSFEAAEAAYKQVKNSKLTVNVTIFNAMLRICLDHKQYSKLEMYWLEHKQLKLLPDEESLTIMFHGYSRQGLFVKAIEVMEKIAKPTLQTWESFLLYLIGREILTKESMQLLDRLRTMGELGKRYGLIQQLEEHRNQVKTFVKKAVPSIHSLLAEHKDLFLK